MPRHKKTTAMDFPAAVNEVTQNNRKVTRLSWGNPAVYVCMADGYLKIRIADGAVHALIVSEGDLRGVDWVAVGDH